MKKAASSISCALSFWFALSTSIPAYALPAKTESQSIDPWIRYFDAAQKSYLTRNYQDAEKKVLVAIKESKRVGSDPTRLLESRLLLANVLLAEERFPEASELYSWCLAESKSLKGVKSTQYAQSLNSLAQLYLRDDKAEKAESYARQALAIRESILGPDHADVGKTLILLASILAKESWFDDAQPLFARGRQILEKSPGHEELDLADGLRCEGIFLQERGERVESRQLFQRSFTIKEKAVRIDRPNTISGDVRFKWEEGSPMAQEIIDVDFPLRYISVAGVRVAVTVIDLWELVGVLICITNVTEQREEVGLGKVVVELAKEQKNTRAQILHEVDPKGIDRIRRERNIWDLTQNRPWLANIQKTRTVRGLVPPHGHDLFRGPNVFGVYGEWPGVSHLKPARAGILLSREGLQYETEVVVEQPALVRSGSGKMKGLVHIVLEPLESRTGELFYLNPRGEDVLIKVPVGNATFEFPFHCRKKRIP